MNILGVRIDNFDKKEILEKIEFFLSEEKFHQIATVNPEFILRAQKDEKFRKILNETVLNVADGIGVKYAFARYFSWLKVRIAGVDLLEEILQIANKLKLSVFFAISTRGLSSYDEIRKIVKLKYPNIKISGLDIDAKKDKRWPKVSKRDIVFCNFGFPKQEEFLNFSKNDTIRLAMGVGGSFDFMTEKVKRAPIWMRKYGLEWLWRLMKEPRYRFKRIINAVFVFPFKIIFSKNNE